MPKKTSKKSKKSFIYELLSTDSHRNVGGFILTINQNSIIIVEKTTVELSTNGGKIWL